MPSMFILKDGSMPGAPTPALAFGREQEDKVLEKESGPFDFVGKHDSPGSAKSDSFSSTSRKRSLGPLADYLGFEGIFNSELAPSGTKGQAVESM